MTMKKITRIFLFVLVVFLASCKTPTSDDLRLTEEFEAAVATGIVETLNASMIQPTEPGQQPTSMPVDGNPTVKPSQPATATTSLQPTQTLNVIAPTATEVPVPCYRAELVEETIPDGTVIPAGTWFAKVWVIKNTGVCEWTEKFRWVLVDGEDFSADTDLPLNQSVLPGEEIKILLELKAPLITGNFKGTYQILTEDGASVTPLGFWVTIAVQ